MSRWFLAVPVLLIGVGLASANYLLIIANLGEQAEEKKDQLAGGQPGAAAQGGQVGGRGRFGGGGARGGQAAPGGAPKPAEGKHDVEAAPMQIVAIVELLQPLSYTPTMLSVRNFESGAASLRITHKWGVSSMVSHTNIHTATLIKLEGKSAMLDNLNKRFLTTKFDPKKADVNPKTKEKFTPDQLFDVADWALQHGMVGKEDRVAQVMDKLAELDPKHPAVAPYQKVKSMLARQLSSESASPKGLETKFGGSWKRSTSPHFTLLHDFKNPGKEPEEVRTRLDRLEEALRAYYYWFALHNGSQMPELPRYKLTDILTSNSKEFNQLYDMLNVGQLVAGVKTEGAREPMVLGAKPVKPLVVSDGFFGRREGIAVFSSKRLDELYDALEKFSLKYWQAGIDRNSIFSRRFRPPLGVPLNVIEEAQSIALLFKAMESDSELSSTTHNATRQLLYTSGLLPRRVLVPEWIEFGMGSFFETSPGSPWPTVGTVNHSYMVPFKSLLESRKLGRSPADTLRAIVTDSYFRHMPAGKEKATGIRKARATAWSLTYFLAQKKIDGLMRYFKELGGNNVPRDLELNEETLLLCFARAFDCVDGPKTVNESKLGMLATQWLRYIEDTEVEAEMKGVQNLIQSKLTESTQAAKK